MTRALPVQDRRGPPRAVPRRASGASETFSIANPGAGLDVNLEDGAPHDAEVRYRITDDTAEVGFTAATASAWESHCLMDWHLDKLVSQCPLSSFKPQPPCRPGA